MCSGNDTSQKAGSEIPVVFYKTKMCRYFLAGTCSKDSSCVFAHDPADLMPPPDFSCTRMCKIFVRTGACNAPDCKWAHSQEELRRRKPSSAELAQKKEKKKGKALKAKLLAAAEAACAQTSPTDLPPVPGLSRQSTADFSAVAAAPGVSSFASVASSPASTVALSSNFLSGSSTLSEMGHFSHLSAEMSSFATSQVLSGLAEEVSTPVDSSDTSERSTVSSIFARQNSRETKGDAESITDGTLYSRPMRGNMNSMRYQVKNTFLEFAPEETESDTDMKSSGSAQSGRPRRSSSVPRRGSRLIG